VAVVFVRVAHTTSGNVHIPSEPDWTSLVFGASVSFIARAHSGLVSVAALMPLNREEHDDPPVWPAQRRTRSTHFVSLREVADRTLRRLERARRRDRLAAHARRGGVHV